MTIKNRSPYDIHRASPHSVDVWKVASALAETYALQNKQSQAEASFLQAEKLATEGGHGPEVVGLLQCQHSRWCCNWGRYDEALSLAKQAEKNVQDNKFKRHYAILCRIRAQMAMGKPYSEDELQAIVSSVHQDKTLSTEMMQETWTISQMLAGRGNYKRAKQLLEYFLLPGIHPDIQKIVQRRYDELEKREQVGRPSQ